MLGSAKALRHNTADGFAAPTRHRILRQIHSSGEHLLQLINDILDLSKVEAGQMDLHLGPVEVGNVIEDVRTTVEPLARSKSIALTIEPSPELRLVADAAKVRQMLLHLVSNAIKFTHSGGRIDVRSRQVPAVVESGVYDTSIGHAQQGLGRLFKEV